MEELEILMERYELALHRVKEIKEVQNVSDDFKEYFSFVADFILQMDKLRENICNDSFETMSFEELRNHNISLYRDILPENYMVSYANPEYSVDKYGELYGRALSLLYSELRGMIICAYEKRIFDMTIDMELFLQVYLLFEEEEQPEYSRLREIFYWHASDYSDVYLRDRTMDKLLPERSFGTAIVMNSDLEDLRYLFKYGEYVSDNEIGVARFLNALPQEKIDAMAKTFSEGYRIGFVLGNKDLSKKETVEIRYNIGFERIIKSSINNFKELNLKPILTRTMPNMVNGIANKLGITSTSPNRQYEYDHKYDNAIFLDRDFNERRLGVLRNTYEEYMVEAGKFAGPAVMEVFGEEGFIPVTKKANFSYNEFEQKLVLEYSSCAGRIVNEYIKGEERSFTIIAFPIPEIGKDFEKIFEETVKINTLDYELYKGIQQSIIDVLDASSKVHIVGSGDNKTDLTVNLIDIKSDKETKFENCLADVNIPLGEIFTSPKLSGTNGTLCVSEVFLNGLKFKNLMITFEDGMIKDYSCDNFQDKEEGKKYIKLNVLFNHETLPMGEFAIGTNTVAYMMARKYMIEDKLPILIAEKTGPHFAVGDTCYSHSEDVRVYNPNGKEIVAKDNEITSKYRDKEPMKAYFNCHTDITIPYDEIGLIEAVAKDGSKISIIKDGRFVLSGTEKLNEPFAID